MKKNYHIISPVTPSTIFLPPEIREALNLKEGEEYEIEVKGNSITFTYPAAAKRAAWIDRWFDRWYLDYGVHTGYMGNITAVELDGEVGISKPCKGDKYDEKTGIAVAYAKASGADIPKYI